MGFSDGIATIYEGATCISTQTLLQIFLNACEEKKRQLYNFLNLKIGGLSNENCLLYGS
jgi:hypothetical protein